jgi:transposase
MSTERIDILQTWNEATRIERDALVSARQKIVELLDEREAGDYPTMSRLDESIKALDYAHAQRAARIESLELRAARENVESSRLTMLLRRQEGAQEDRKALVEARDRIVRDARADGQDDLDDEQDRRFRALTHEIAEVDDEIVARDKEIETEAALAAVTV